MRIPLRVFVVALAVLFIAAGGSFGSAHAQTAYGGVSGTTYINGDWTVRGWTNESNVVLQVNGSVRIQAGAHLNLDNVTLKIQESSNVEYGVTVDLSGSLNAKNLVFESTDPLLHTYLLGSPGSLVTLQGGRLLDLGAAGGGEVGLLIQGNGSSVEGITFDHYNQAIVVSSASDVSVSNVTVRNSTAASNSTPAVSVYGQSPHFSITNSVFDVPQNVPALSISATYATVRHDTFNVDVNGTQRAAVVFTADGNGLSNAAHSIFENNSLSGTGFIDDAGSNVTISSNRIVDNGPNRAYGILVETPLFTAPELWTRYVTISNNYISDYSDYAIRIQQNVSNFVVSGNTIVDPSTHPGPASYEQWGGLQVTGIYIIRGVENGLVTHNYIDLSDLPWIASTGLILESKVSNIVVTYNTFLNATQDGVDIQGNLPGFDNAYPWECGPTVYNYFGNNLFENLRYISQTNFSVNGIVEWNWANWTTIVNNTFTGWQTVKVATMYDGAVILTDGSYGLYANNTIEGARYGFVFTNLSWSTPNPYPGQFNRSYNLVYGNFLTGITVNAVVETPTDGEGPLHNVIDVLTNSSVSPGVPSSDVETISPAVSLSSSESNGTFRETVRTSNPLGGGVKSFTTSIPWSISPFSIASSGGLGSGSLSQTLISVNRTAVEYQVPVVSSQQESVNLHPPTNASWSLYSVGVKFGSSKSSFNVNTTTGSADFRASGTGTATVSADLIRYGYPSQGNTGGSNNSTGTNTTTWGIEGSVTLAGNASVANLSVELELVGPEENSTWIDINTTANGTFAVSGLNSQADLGNVSLGPGAYTILNMTVNSSDPDLWTLTIYAEVTPWTWGIEGSVALTNDTSAANLSVGLEIVTPTGNATWLDSCTSTNGTFAVGGLNPEDDLANVSLGPGAYTILNLTINSSNPYLWMLTIYAELTPVPVNNSTSPNPNGTAPPPPSGGGSPNPPPPGNSETTTPSPSKVTSGLFGSSTWTDLLVVADLLALGAVAGGLAINVHKTVRARRYARWKSSGRKF